MSDPSIPFLPGAVTEPTTVDLVATSRAVGAPMRSAFAPRFDAIAAVGDEPIAAGGVAPRTEWTVGRLVLLGGVLAYVGLVVLVPMGALVLQAFQQGGRALWAELSSAPAREALGRTLQLTVIAVLANGLFGLAAALVLVRQRFAGRALLDALVDVTFAVSPVMTGLAFLLLFGRTGWFAPLVSAADVPIAFAFPGLVLATLFVTLPFTTREIAHVLAELGDEEEAVAATLGASRWQTFWQVTLPNVRPALIVGVTLTAARALGEFGAVLVLGGAIAGRTQTATTFIYAASEERRDPAAFGMAIVLAAASTVLLVTLEHFKRRSKSS